MKGSDVMGRYRVEIVEKISMPVELDASSPEEALLLVIQKYRAEQIVVESSEGAQVEFSVSEIKA